MDMSEQVTSRMLNLDPMTLWEAFSDCTVIQCTAICDALKDEDYADAGMRLSQVVRDFIEKEERKWAGL